MHVRTLTPQDQDSSASTQTRNRCLFLFSPLSDGTGGEREGKGEKGSAESNTGVHSGDERGGQKDRIGANTAVQSCYPVVTNARAVSLGLDARLANAHDRPM